MEFFKNVLLGILIMMVVIALICLWIIIGDVIADISGSLVLGGLWPFIAMALIIGFYTIGKTIRSM